MGVVPPLPNAPPPNSPGLKPPPNCPGVNPEDPSGEASGGVKSESPVDGGSKPKPSKLGDNVHSICVSVWFIVDSVWVIVSPRFAVRASAET